MVQEQQKKLKNKENNIFQSDIKVVEMDEKKKKRLIKLFILLSKE